MRTVVVGVDGTPESLSALHWAAAAVGPAGRVHAVTAWSPATEVVVASAQADGDTIRRALAASLEGPWLEQVRPLVAETVAHLVRDAPAQALSATAAEVGADAVVVGAHSSPWPRPRRIGALSGALLRHVIRPVVIVPGTPRRPLQPDATVVVGIGHGPRAREVLLWAAEMARPRRLSLELVHAVGRPTLLQPDGLSELLAYTIDPSQLRVWAEEDLVALAQEIEAMAAEASPTMVPLGWHTPAGRAGPRLVDVAVDLDATLIVVGTHHGLLGQRGTATSLHHVLTHAPCPVAVVSVEAGG